MIPKPSSFREFFPWTCRVVTAWFRAIKKPEEATHVEVLWQEQSALQLSEVLPGKG